jgi:methylase of polypeptide subunit release factors
MPCLIAPDSLRRIGEFFSDSGYTREALRDTLELTELPWRKLRNRHFLLHKTEGKTPLHQLAKIFYLGQCTDALLLRKLIPDAIFGLMQDAGMLELAGGVVKPLCMAAPLEHLVLISDQITNMEMELMPDLVLLPNPTTLTVSRFMMRKPAATAFDLGTGCGALALLLAASTERVLGSDINARAIEFARFNAALNGVGNVDFEVGDALEPAKGRQFDLIVANPPFFVSAERQFVFCDSPMDLDGFSRMLAREAPNYLKEGGFFQMMCEWVELDGQRWQDRLDEWFTGNRCDVFVIKGFEFGAAKYAHERLFEANPLHPERDLEIFERRLAYYRQRNVKSVHGGLIAMRRKAGSNWVRIEDIPHPPQSVFDEDVAARFAGQDLAAWAADDQLLDWKPVLGSRVRLRQELIAHDGRWQTTMQRIDLVEGLASSLALEPLVARVVCRLDGNHSVREHAAGLAAETGADAAVAQAEVLRLIRRLGAGGFLDLRPDAA